MRYDDRDVNAYRVIYCAADSMFSADQFGDCDPDIAEAAVNRANELLSEELHQIGAELVERTGEIIAPAIGFDESAFSAEILREMQDRIYSHVISEN